MYEHFIFKAERHTIIMRFQNPFTPSRLYFKLTDTQTTIHITYNKMLNSIHLLLITFYFSAQLKKRPPCTYSRTYSQFNHQYSTVQYSTVQYSTVQYSTAQ